MEKWKAGFCTLGCKVAQYETEAIAESFVKNGFSLAGEGEGADVFVINTCTVTAESDRKCRQTVRRVIRKNPGAVVMICGCYSQANPKALLSIPGVAYVIGNDKKMTLPQKAIELLAARPAAPLCDVGSLANAPFEKMTVESGPRTRVYVKIEDGCSGQCAYCAIAPARGPVRSKPVADVMREVEALGKKGVREVVLTGIETASYGRDLNGVSLIELLETLDKSDVIPQIRLGSLSPELISEEFADRFAKLRHVCPHLHLSLQSGADDVLHRMRRRYGAARAMQSITRLKERVAGVQFTTDIIVGFPGESEEDFEKTLAFCREARFLDVHVFPYSRRPGTPAATFPNQIPEAVKHRRSFVLIAEKNRIKREILAEIASRGEPVVALMENSENGLTFGHTPSYVEVAIEASVPALHGKECKLLPVREENGILICRMAEQ